MQPSLLTQWVSPAGLHCKYYPRTRLFLLQLLSVVWKLALYDDFGIIPFLLWQPSAMYLVSCLWWCIPSHHFWSYQKKAAPNMDTSLSPTSPNHIGCSLLDSNEMCTGYKAGDSGYWKIWHLDAQINEERRLDRKPLRGTSLQDVWADAGRYGSNYTQRGVLYYNTAQSERLCNTHAEEIKACSAVSKKKGLGFVESIWEIHPSIPKL